MGDARGRAWTPEWTRPRGVPWCAFSALVTILLSVVALGIVPLLALRSCRAAPDNIVVSGEGNDCVALLALSFRLADEAPPDRTFRPGEEGHLAALGERSAQGHYHVPGCDRTGIAVRIELGGLRGGVVRGIYEGAPRIVGMTEVTPVELPALVTVAAETGAPRPGLRSAGGEPVPDLGDVAGPDADGITPQLFPWAFLPFGIADGSGRMVYVLEPGRWMLVTPGGVERWIGLGPLDHAEVAPDGQGGWAVEVRAGAGWEVVDDPEDRPR